jgi:hypothetical protein
LIVYERWSIIDEAYGRTSPWGRRFWFARMLLCALARDWCAHGVTWCHDDRLRGVFGIPRSGIGAYQTPEVWARLHAERKVVQRVE